MLKDKQMEQIENGLLEILGTDDSGAYVVAQKTLNTAYCARPVYISGNTEFFTFFVPRLVALCG